VLTVLLPHLRPGRGQAPDGPGLAVLDRGRAGNRPDIVDSGAGCGPPGARRRRRRGDHGPDPRAGRAARRRRPVETGRPPNSWSCWTPDTTHPASPTC
jgi:hypothetical protein